MHGSSLDVFCQFLRSKSPLKPQPYATPARHPLGAALHARRAACPCLAAGSGPRAAPAPSRALVPLRALGSPAWPRGPSAGCDLHQPCSCSVPPRDLSVKIFTFLSSRVLGRCAFDGKQMSPASVPEAFSYRQVLGKARNFSVPQLTRPRAGLTPPVCRS